MENVKIGRHLIRGRSPSVICLSCLAVLSAFGIAKAEEKPLDGEAITELLNSAVLEGTGPQEPWRQIFYEDGRTIYREISNGRDSRGEWRVDGDQFCSLWPPSRKWDCYFMTSEGSNVTFAPVDGSEPWPARITGDKLL